MEAYVRARRWTGDKAPAKILAMRFQALGDTVITLPYLKGLKNKFPDSELHLLTRTEVGAIPENIRLFDRIHLLRGGRNAKLQFLHALRKFPALWGERYDAVLDLQNNRISRTIRRMLQPRSWAEFDRYSPMSAGERTRKTIEALWSWKIEPDYSVSSQVREGENDKLLELYGFKAGHELVILNPAGYCPSRNWPLEYYSEFASGWRAQVNPETQFVLLLLPANRSKAVFLKNAIGDHCIDLTGKADQVRAFDIISRASLMLSEDSGLMHMAWVQGIPTIALFSSSRKDWSGPQGAHSICLDSSDMSCGPCGLEVCMYEDNRCLTRYTPDYVLEQARQLRSMKT